MKKLLAVIVTALVVAAAVWVIVRVQLANQLAAVPELQRVSHLPVVVDPSQGTGKNALVDSMCRAAVAAGADGLIIEVHNDPEHALTDGAQSITPQQFKDMMASIKRIAAAVDREV